MDYDKLIDKHFGVLMNYKAASIEHYIKTGTVSGTFRGALKDMLKEACDGETSDEHSNCNKPLVSGSALLPYGFKVYECTNCHETNVKRDNGEIRVGFCDKCDHPLWN